MKKILLSFGMLLGMALQLAAQPVTADLNLKPLLFRNFLDGTVFMKNGTEEKAVFNYNTNNQQLVFVGNGQYLELTGLENIREVNLGGATFIPIRGKFYERTERPDLVIYYSNRTVPKDVGSDKTGTGLRNSGEVSNTVTTYVNRAYQNRSDIRYVRNFGLLMDENIYPADSPAALAKAFGLSKSHVRILMDKYKTDTQEQKDVTALIDLLKEKSN
jgi:hypothetical protein